MNWSPHDYQKEVMRFIVAHGHGAIFLDPGLGKTSCIYGADKILRQQNIIRRTLVISPLRPAISVWPGEQAKWSDFAGTRIALLHGAHKEEAYRAKADIDIVNPEGLSWLLNRVAKEKQWPWDMLVVDESTRFKHSSTLRFKLLKLVLSRFKRRYILTGSPAPNGLLDLFGQVYILDLGDALGKFITHYRRKYFDQVGFGGFSYQLKSGAAERIQEAIRPLVIRMAAQDYLEMPPLLFNDILVDIPAEARRIYNQMEKDLIAQIQTSTVMASSVGVATMKCRQIANGGIFKEDHSALDIHDSKIEAVVGLVDELGGKPALISYEFGHDLSRLQKAFPEAPFIGGGVSAKQQRDIELKWNAGCLPVLLAQPQSVAHGLNLQGVGAAVIFHSLTWNLEDYEQLIRRIWRQGQRERVVVHHIIARKTVDLAVMAAIKAKDRTQQSLLASLKTYLAGSKSELSKLPTSGQEYLWNPTL